MDICWDTFNNLIHRYLCNTVLGRFTHQDKYESDVYFAGADKGRLSLLKQVYKYLTERGIKCLFYVTSVEESKVEKESGIIYNVWCDYEEVLEHCMKTRCLLDVIQPGQDGATYREGEACAYGIKLLTNYLNITKERYYNKSQMKVFCKPEDIDIDFILAPYTSDDFPYDGCLSPYKRLEWLSKYFDNEKRI